MRFRCRAAAGVGAGGLPAAARRAASEARRPARPGRCAGPPAASTPGHCSPPRPAQTSDFDICKTCVISPFSDVVPGPSPPYCPAVGPPRPDCQPGAHGPRVPQQQLRRQRARQPRGRHHGSGELGDLWSAYLPTPSQPPACLRSPCSLATPRPAGLAPSCRPAAVAASGGPHTPLPSRRLAPRPRRWLTTGAASPAPRGAPRSWPARRSTRRAGASSPRSSSASNSAGGGRPKGGL